MELNNMEAGMTLTVRQGSKTRFIHLHDIIYIESIGRKAALHLQDETVEYYAKISDLEKQLGAGFFRIHRAYLVNLSYVESYNKREARLKNSDSVLISKYRFQQFKDAVSEKHI